MTTAEKSLPKNELSSRNKKRKDARICVLTDANFHATRPGKRILKELGAVGYGVAAYLKEIMRVEKTLSISRNDLDLFADDLNLTVEEIQNAVDVIIKSEHFVEVDEGIMCPSLSNDIDHFELKKQQARKRMQESRNKRERERTLHERARTSLPVQEPEEVPDEEQAKEQATKKKSGGQPKTQHGEHKHVWLSNSEVERYKLKFGEDFLNRAIEKLDSWIASDPIPKRIRNGKNASACFGSWVFNAIAEEQQKSLSTSHSGKSPPGKNSVSESYKRIFEEIAK